MPDQPTISIDALIERVDGLRSVPQETFGSPGDDRSSSGRRTEISDIQIDSRSVRPGSLFVALPGSRTDGHAFIDDAIAAGASAVLAQSGRVDPSTVDVPVLEAANTRRILGDVAATFFGYPAGELVVVGVTGTNGKTTTAHLIADVLGKKWSVGTIGTIGASWGDRRTTLPNTTPESLTLQRLLWRMSGDGMDAVVLEVSSHGLETYRMRGTPVDIAVFTNLTQDHLDFHGDLASYRSAKAKLFEEHLVGEGGGGREGQAPVGLLNVGDETGRRFADRFEQYPFRVARFAVASDANGERDGAHDGVVEDRAPDYLADRLSLSIDATEFRFRSADWSRRIRTPMLGAFNVENATAAAGVAAELGMRADDIAQGLAEARGVRGRMERVTGDEKSGGRGADPEEPAVFVDYAHTPDALERALTTLRPLTAGRLTVVFGCGGDRDRGKRSDMGRVARAAANRVVVTSDNPRSEDPDAIIDDILAGMPAVDTGRNRAGFPSNEHPVAVVPDRGDAIRLAVKGADPRDTVLIAGKGHETYQSIEGEQRPFDDVRRARAALMGRSATGHRDDAGPSVGGDDE